MGGENNGQRQELGREGSSPWTTGPASNLTDSQWDGQRGPFQKVSGRHRNRERSFLGVGQGSYIRSSTQEVSGVGRSHLGLA